MKLVYFSWVISDEELYYWMGCICDLSQFVLRWLRCLLHFKILNLHPLVKSWRNMLHLLVGQFSRQDHGLWNHLHSAKQLAINALIVNIAVIGQQMSKNTCFKSTQLIDLFHARCAHLDLQKRQTWIDMWTFIQNLSDVLSVQWGSVRSFNLWTIDPKSIHFLWIRHWDDEIWLLCLPMI